jgi:hypothetical protein
MVPAAVSNFFLMTGKRIDIHRKEREKREQASPKDWGNREEPPKDALTSADLAAQRYAIQRKRKHTKSQPRKGAEVPEGIQCAGTEVFGSGLVKANFLVLYGRQDNFLFLLDPHR